jgi:PTH1 family peptidyl-tRNA hydrolase
MILIIGLGNPGKKYQNTRHNIGFRVVESLKHAPYRNEVSGAGLKVKSFSDWKKNKKFQAEISEGEISGQKVTLAKPQTLMNLSGKTVKAIFNFQFSIFNQFSIRQFSNKNLIVIHDDIDLPLGKIKISMGRGSAGHKGVESIIKEIGIKNFARFRIGIKPKQYHRLVYGIKEFVLQKFNEKEEKVLKEVIKKTAEAIKFYLEKGLEKAMSKYNE